MPESGQTQLRHRERVQTGMVVNCMFDTHCVYQPGWQPGQLLVCAPAYPGQVPFALLVVDNCGRECTEYAWSLQLCVASSVISAVYIVLCTAYHRFVCWLC